MTDLLRRTVMSASLLGLLFCLAPTFISAQSVFRSVPAASSGINFSNEVDETEERNIITYEYYYNGGGVAIGDLDNDGLDDIFFTANQGKSKAYRNLGNFKFKEIPESSGLSIPDGWTTGCTMADVNGDGLLDIYVARSGNVEPAMRRNLLFINQGKMKFKEMAGAYGLDLPSYSTHAAFFDMDRDGDLDAYVLNHNIRSPKGFYVAVMKDSIDEFAGDRLMRNDNGVFTDITKVSKIHSNPIGFGLGLAVLDVNSDGWPDLYVGNDYFEQDYLYINDQKGGFIDSLAQYMRQVSMFTMGVDAADINNDLRDDIITLDMLPMTSQRERQMKGPPDHNTFMLQLNAGFGHQYMRNMLQLNRGDGSFSEVAQMAGVSRTDWSWCPLLADFDQDGFKDLFITNGYWRDVTDLDFLKYDAPAIQQKAKAEGRDITHLEQLEAVPQTPMADQLFLNRGGLRFDNVTERSGLGEPRLSHGAALADLDNDGDLDLVVNSMNHAAGIYENQSKGKGFTVKLKGKGKNTYALGAKVVLHLDSGQMSSKVYGTRGFQSSSAPYAHFGIPAGRRPEMLEVLWPDGSRSCHVQQSPGNTVTISNGGAEPCGKENTQVAGNRILTPVTIPSLQALDLQESSFIDFLAQPLMPHLLSREGPALATADVNGDGLDDFFIGGPAGKPSSIFIQTSDGSFTRGQQDLWEQFAPTEDVAALFFDADGDGDSDLYVGSGSYEFPSGAGQLLDRLYINDGKGNFTYSQGALPQRNVSTSSVLAIDIDSDGDLDLLTGTRVLQQTYPRAPGSFLLINEKGKFADRTDEVAPVLKGLGMVTSMVDLTAKNGAPKLMAVGELMAPTVLVWEAGKLVKESAGLDGLTGMWLGTLATDLDGDGDLDVVLGNLGQNSQMTSHDSVDVRFYHGDFNGDGLYDVFPCYRSNGQLAPLYSKDIVMGQLAELRKAFPSYSSYSEADLDAILKGLNAQNAEMLTCREGRSGVLWNDGGKYSFNPFPALAQVSPLRAFVTIDVNGDGRKDLVAAGNEPISRTEYGKDDAGNGIVLIQGIGHDFAVMPGAFKVVESVRAASLVKGKGGTRLLFAVSGFPPQMYDINKISK